MKIIIIPARMDSVRFPGKPLHKIAGRPLLQWTYEASACSEADRIYVATNDQDIIKFCEENYINWVMTGKNCQTGTHRCADALGRIEESQDIKIDKVINLQVDEPMIDANDLDELLSDSFGEMIIGTLVTPNSGKTSFVRAVYSKVNAGECLWFSRRDIASYQHIGVYCYSAALLRMLGTLPSTVYSQRENLEQLAWLEYGFSVCANECSLAEGIPISVNTLEDAMALEARLSL